MWAAETAAGWLSSAVVEGKSKSGEAWESKLILVKAPWQAN